MSRIRELLFVTVMLSPFAAYAHDDPAAQERERRGCCISLERVYPDQYAAPEYAPPQYGLRDDSYELDRREYTSPQYTSPQYTSPQYGSPY